MYCSTAHYLSPFNSHCFRLFHKMGTRLALCALLLLFALAAQGERLTAQYLQECCRADLDASICAFVRHCKASVREDNILFTTQLDLDPGLDSANLDDSITMQYYLRNTDFFALGNLLIVQQEGIYDFGDFHVREKWK